MSERQLEVILREIDTIKRSTWEDVLSFIWVQLRDLENRLSELERLTKTTEHKKEYSIVSHFTHHLHDAVVGKLASVAKAAGLTGLASAATFHQQACSAASAVHGSGNMAKVYEATAKVLHTAGDLAAEAAHAGPISGDVAQALAETNNSLAVGLIASN